MTEGKSTFHGSAITENHPERITPVYSLGLVHGALAGTEHFDYSGSVLLSAAVYQRRLVFEIQESVCAGTGISYW